MAVAKARAGWWTLAWKAPLMAVRMAMTRRMTLPSKFRLTRILLQSSSSETLPQRHSNPHRPSCLTLRVQMLYVGSLTRQNQTPLLPLQLWVQQSRMRRGMINSGAHYTSSAWRRSSLASSLYTSIHTHPRASDLWATRSIRQSMPPSTSSPSIHWWQSSYLCSG